MFAKLTPEKQDRSRKRIKSDPVRKPFERSGDKNKVFAQVSKDQKKLLVISIEKAVTIESAI